MTHFSDFDVIMLALPRWDGPYSSTAFSLAKEISRNRRVFYVDNPITIKEYWTKRNTREMKRRSEALFNGSSFFTNPDEKFPNLFAITPKLMLPINFLPYGKIYEWLSEWNDVTLEKSLNKLIRIFGIRKYVLINSFNPLFGRRLKLSVKPMLTIYQSVDDIAHAPYMNRHGERLENEWIRKSDFTITTSSQLKKIKSALSPNVFLLPNAADVGLFQQAVLQALPRPVELKQIPLDKKVICYTGNICQRLDYELLKKVAQHHHDKILLMVGPFARNDYATSGLNQLPNVVFTGRKRIEELPAYLSHSDCCIIPFLCNELTASIYPLKINEYLSAGKPVVTTDFSEDIRLFKKVAYISTSHDIFIEMISKSIAEDGEERKLERVHHAADNNWEARAHHFIELVVEFLKHDVGRTRNTKRRARANVFDEQRV